MSPHTTPVCIVTRRGDSRRAFRLVICFIDHYNTQLVIPLNYSAVTNLQALQFTLAHAKSFPTPSVFISNCLVTDSNNDYYYASLLKPSLSGGSLSTAQFFLQFPSLQHMPFLTNEGLTCDVRSQICELHRIFRESLHCLYRAILELLQRVT